MLDLHINGPILLKWNSARDVNSATAVDTLSSACPQTFVAKLMHSSRIMGHVTPNLLYQNRQVLHTTKFHLAEEEYANVLGREEWCLLGCYAVWLL
jgi:hypothetical protein